MLRNPLQPLLRPLLRAPTAPSSQSVLRRALAILRRPGIEAHVYLPGATQTSYGVELVTNGGFDSATGWTFSSTAPSTSDITGGQATVTSDGSSRGRVRQVVGVVAGKTYVVQFTSTGLDLWVGSSLGLADLVNSPIVTGEKSHLFTATGSSVYIQLSRQAVGTFYGDNISVREVITTSVVLSGLQAANYLDSAGTTLATVDQPVGLVLDGMGSVGVELVSNPGPFTTAAASTADQAGDFANDATYAVTYTATGAGIGNIILYANGKAGLHQVLSGTNTAYVTVTTVSATATDTLRISGISAGTISGVSLKQVTGIHATQPTTMAKPRLERGARNLLTYSGDFSQGDWVAFNTTKVSGFAGHGGSMTAYKIAETASTAQHAFYRQNTTLVAGTTYTVSAYVKQAERTWAKVSTFGSATWGGSDRYAFVNLATGAIGAVVGATGVSVSDAGNGYWCVAFQAVVTTGGSSGGLWILPATADATDNYVGTAGSGILISSAALFQGTLTAAQILAEGGIPLTTTAAASNPSAGKYSWAFDGGDSLALGSVPFLQADDFSVHIAARLDTAGANRTLYSHSNASNHQIAWVYFNATGNLVWTSWDGTTSVNITSPSTYLGVPIVIRARKIGNTGTLWINGVQVATASLAGVGSPTLTSANIGSFNTAALQHIGTMGSTLPLKGTQTDAEGLTIDRLVASNFPNAPQF